MSSSFGGNSLFSMDWATTYVLTTINPISTVYISPKSQNQRLQRTQSWIQPFLTVFSQACISSPYLHSQRIPLAIIMGKWLNPPQLWFLILPALLLNTSWINPNIYICQHTYSHPNCFENILANFQISRFSPQNCSVWLTPRSPLDKIQWLPLPCWKELKLFSKAFRRNTSLSLLNSTPHPSFFLCQILTVTHI